MDIENGNESTKRRYEAYPYVKKSIVDQAFGFFDAYTNELNGGNPEDTGAMLRLLLLLNNADSVVFDLLDEVNRLGREINKPGHRDDCPLRSGLHYTNMIANGNKDVVSITERSDPETGKYKDIELHNWESKERNRIPFPYCPICGGCLYKKGNN